jgi:dipeptidyl aminopeptidase/acylaminoacyl peptidase
VTPDGGYVDVLEVDASITFKTRVLRVPLLGGAPRQLLGDGVRSGIGWSADGQRMVFNRSDAPAENSIVIADAQGQNLRVLATRRAPSFFINVTFGRRAARPAWSPDGRRIAALGLKNSPDGIDQHLVEIDVETGSERVMHRFVAASEVAYLDQDRWLASAVQPETMTVPWEVIPRQGSPVAITRDLSLLRGVQLTTDRSTGVALRTTLRSAIAVGAIAGADFAQAIEESGTEPGNAALDGAGNVFYSMRTSDGFAVFRRAREGGASTLIVRNLARPVPSNDGTFLFGRRLNVGMIRASVDGSDARVVLEDASADPLALSRDNRTLVLQSNRGGHQQPWRLSLETAAVERLSERSINGGQLWLSPDERQVIFTTTGGGAPGPTLCAFPSFDPCRLVNMIPGPLSPDGKRVYGISRADPANILMQPLDGGTPTPLTRFTDRRIRDFSVSPDGTRMAITRGMETSDVVLFKGLK